MLNMFFLRHGDKLRSIRQRPVTNVLLNFEMMVSMFEKPPYPEKKKSRHDAPCSLDQNLKNLQKMHSLMGFYRDLQYVLKPQRH